MSAEAQKKVLALLDELCVSYKVIRHPEVFTIEEMENLNIEHMDKIAKNLFVRDDKKNNFYLIVMQNDKTANLKNLRRLIGSRPLSFANEEELNKYLGLSSGEVTPFGALNDTENVVTVIFDNSLTRNEFIGVHPNDNTATVLISPDEIIKILKSKNKKIIFVDL